VDRPKRRRDGAGGLRISPCSQEAITMKRTILTGIMVLAATFWVSGCITTSGNTSGSGSTGRKASSSEGGLYSQVPASMRADVKEAQYDLKTASDELNLAQEKVKLAELEKERAILKNKHAELNKTLAEIIHEKSALLVELKKAEAIDNSGLGDKEDNIKQITKLKTKELGVETDQVKTEGEISSIELKIRSLDKQIAEQAGRVRSADKRGGSSVATTKKKKKK
jgi:chromosome segregation ATPase